MQMTENPAAAVWCLLAGIMIYTAWLAAVLHRRKKLRPANLWVILLPGLLGIGCARGGFELLQMGDSFASFRWCYTAGMAGVLLGTWLAARAAGAEPGETMDRCAGALCLAMAAARFAQRWLGETGIGPILESSPFFAMTNDWEESVFATWMLEGFACLLAAAAVFVADRRNPRAAGGTVCLAVFLLTVPQILIEQFRSGTYLRYQMMRLEQLLFAVCALAALWWLCRRAGEGRGIRAYLPIPVFLALTGIIAAIQFSLDGKLLDAPAWLLWTMYAGTVAAMLALCCVQICAADRAENR